MATYIIGDIQGCYAEFCDLLRKCSFQPGEDRLWLVGDLVNRGPDNLAVINHLMQLPDVQVVLGNHDLHFLAVASGVRKASRSDTLSDLLDAENLAKIIDWLRKWPLLHYDDANKIAMVHAGIPHIWTLEDGLRYASEVEQVLRGNDYQAFLEAMYGNQPDTWHENLQGLDRLRLITNYFTRLRFCKVNGQLELTAKTDIAPEGYSPWFSFKRRAEPPFQIVFGHWAALEGKTGKRRAIALDTGCVWGRTLTALRLEDQTYFSVPARPIS